MQTLSAHPPHIHARMRVWVCVRVEKKGVGMGDGNTLHVHLPKKHHTVWTLFSRLMFSRMPALTLPSSFTLFSLRVPARTLSDALRASSMYVWESVLKDKKEGKVEEGEVYSGV